MVCQFTWGYLVLRAVHSTLLAFRIQGSLEHVVIPHKVSGVAAYSWLLSY